MITISPYFARLLRTSEAATYNAAATAYDVSTAPDLLVSWPTQNDVSLPTETFMGQHWVSLPSNKWGVGVYILAYDLSTYNFDDILSVKIKFDTQYWAIANNEQDPATLQVRVFRKYYYVSGTTSGPQYFKSNQWPNPNAGDAYELLDEVELEDSIYEGPKFDFLHDVTFTLAREHLEINRTLPGADQSAGQVLWIVLNEKDHFDLTDPQTLASGSFYYKSVGFVDPPVLEITVPKRYSAAINANPAVEATLSESPAEPALIFTKAMDRSIYFDSATVGYSDYQNVKGVGATNYLTPVVPSKRLVPQSVLKPSQKEAI